MLRKLAGLAIASTLLAGSVSQIAFAQDAREAQMLGLHQMCYQGGDKKACIKFGMMLQQNQDHHAEWRRTHPEFFFFER